MEGVRGYRAFGPLNISNFRASREPTNSAFNIVEEVRGEPPGSCNQLGDQEILVAGQGMLSPPVKRVSISMINLYLGE